MRTHHSSRLARATLAAAVLIGSSAAALAGQCPPGKAAHNGQPPGPSKHSGVAERVLSMIPLANEKVGLKEHSLRLRRLVVQPGGAVAWHSHADRPAIIYVVSGTITEYSSHCAVPIVHRAGETSTESGGLSHWWRNHTRQPVVLLSADLLHDHNDHHM